MTGNSPKAPGAKFLGSDGHFCFISICKFCNFKNPFATITSLSELYFRYRSFMLLVQMKKMISMNYGSSKSSCKPLRWVRFDLILLVRDIYIDSNLNPPIKFTSSSRSTEFKENISKNLQSFLEISPIQNEVLPLINCKTMHMSSRILSD